MNILICGASGFVGRHLTRALRQAGHTVFRGVRLPSEPSDIAMDYRTDTRKDIWLPRLAGITIVINAVGVLRDSRNNPMAQLHTETPSALFAACAEGGVERIVQLSALGVDRGIDTPYFTTRRQADIFLQELPSQVRRLVLRPSVIYGHDGASARMFRCLARLPVHVLPGDGRQPLQPVHIKDICAAVTRWAGDHDANTLCVNAVGADATMLRGMLSSYREQMGLPAAMQITTPLALMKLVARLGDYFDKSPLCSDTLTMLMAGNVADCTGFASLLGRLPMSYQTFIADSDGHA